MMNRREMISIGAGAAIAVGMPKAWAATYDLIIKGGRVIDPSVGLDGIRDVAIAAGRIAAVEAGIAGDATETIDARGKIVAPGLIDIHTHAGRGKDSPALALQDGVTGYIDAGSGGPDNIDEIAAVVRGGPQIGRALINVASAPASPAASFWTSTAPMSAWCAGGSRAIAMWWSASRRGCRPMSPAPTISRGCAAPRRRPRLRPAGDDPYRPVGIADARNFSPAQARRHRHPHVRAAAERHP